MRFSTTAAYLAAYLAAPATALAIFSSPASALGGLKVPGESPLEYCDADREDDLLVVEKVDIAPNPPKAGQALQITASGEFKSTISKGAYVKITVKYGLIQLISTTMDLCEQLVNIDLSCPIEPGKMTLTKGVELPAAIPPGTYNVFADVYSNDDEKITCLKASVNFPRPSFGSIQDTEEL